MSCVYLFYIELCFFASLCRQHNHIADILWGVLGAFFGLISATAAVSSLTLTACKRAHFFAAFNNSMAFFDLTIFSNIVIFSFLSIGYVTTHKHAQAFLSFDRKESNARRGIHRFGIRARMHALPNAFRLAPTRIIAACVVHVHPSYIQAELAPTGEL